MGDASRAQREGAERGKRAALVYFGLDFGRIKPKSDMACMVVESLSMEERRSARDV